MKLTEMKSMSKEELLKTLNEHHTNNPEFIIDSLRAEVDVEDYDGLCAECFYQTIQKSSGDEGLTWCESCQTTEGKTYEVAVIPDLGIAYNWDTKYWIPQTEEMGFSDL